MSPLLKVTLINVSIVLFFISIYLSFFGPVDNKKQNIVFIIPQNKAEFNLTDSLKDNGLIRNKSGFSFIYNKISNKENILAGGYKLNTSMNVFQIIKRLEGDQDLKWVNIFYCPRKEQVGEKLAEVLGWDSNKLISWNNLYKNTDYYEGVFYPDTYLIPVDESVEEVSRRFLNRFNEKFDHVADQYLSKNIKWTTGIKIASLVAREAAGRDDAKLISGIIWNRLNQDMRLQIDATMQYTHGKNDKGSWWGSISLAEKQSDSPYNSYRYEGLPPTPICSPNIDFIEAALNPETTDCIFYLHDQNRQIHCAKTYEEHKENIKKYL